MATNENEALFVDAVRNYWGNLLQTSAPLYQNGTIELPMYPTLSSGFPEAPFPTVDDTAAFNALKQLFVAPGASASVLANVRYVWVPPRMQLTQTSTVYEGGSDGLLVDLQTPNNYQLYFQNSPLPYRNDNFMTFFCTAVGVYAPGGIGFAIGQTPACDAVMIDYCARTSDNKLCGCFLDEQTFAKQFDGANLPVACFGPRCREPEIRSADGAVLQVQYLTQDMVEQATCTADFCESVVNAEGSKIFIDGTETLECAGSVYQANGTIIPPTDPPSIQVTAVPTPPAEGIPLYTWILFGLGLALSGVLLYLILR